MPTLWKEGGDLLPFLPPVSQQHRGAPRRSARLGGFLNGCSPCGGDERAALTAVQSAAEETKRDERQLFMMIAYFDSKDTMVSSTAVVSFIRL